MADVGLLVFGLVASSGIGGRDGGSRADGHRAGTRCNTAVSQVSPALKLVLALMALACALPGVNAETVLTDGSTATAIRNLEVHGTLYDVEFKRENFSAMLAAGDFPFIDDQPGALRARNAIVAALRKVNVTSAGPSSAEASTGFGLPYQVLSTSYIATGINHQAAGWEKSWVQGGGFGVTGRYIALREVEPLVAQADVDPWSADNIVRPDSSAAITVAVLGASVASGDPADFDVTQINPAALALGPGKAPNTALSPLYGDYDADGNTDAAFTFRTEASGIRCDDTEVNFYGELTNGAPFTAVAPISTTECSRAHDWGTGMLIVSGDTDVVYGSALNTPGWDNGRFARNVLGDGTRVRIHTPNYWTANALEAFYNAIAGVSADQFDSEITEYALADTDLLVLHIGLMRPAWYSARETEVINHFMRKGGRVFLQAEADNSSYTTTWNDFLANIGSAIRFFRSDRIAPGGTNFADDIAPSPLNEDVAVFRVAYANYLRNGYRIIKYAGYTIISTEVFGPATVQVDADPFNSPNVIRPDSTALIPAAVLGASIASGAEADFDVTQIDPQTLRLGPAQAPNIALTALYGDYDGDGNSDAAFGFRSQDTGIYCGDTEVTLTGETFSGLPFEGTDAIQTEDCEATGCHP